MEVKQEWSDSVQAYWKELENQLVKLVDELAPLTIVINENIPVPIHTYQTAKLDYAGEPFLKCILFYNEMNFLIKKINQQKKFENGGKWEAAGIKVKIRLRD